VEQLKYKKKYKSWHKTYYSDEATSKPITLDLKAVKKMDTL